MKTAITKVQIIEALDERISLLKLRRDELIEKLFEVQTAAEEKIKELNTFGFIDTADWGVSWYKGKYNNYFMYKDEIIEYCTGGYDGGDFNYRLTPTNYPLLLEFVSKADEIVKGMADALEEKLNEIERISSGK